MQTGNRFRCYPSPAQAQILLRWLGCQRFIYNAKVSEDRYFRAFARKTLAMTGTCPPVDQIYAQFIGEATPWLCDVPSQVLRNGAVRWAQAYQRFFQGLAGRPKIRDKHGPQSLWLTSELFAFEPTVSTLTGEVLGHRLLVGTQKFPVGTIAFTAHKDYRLPASIRLVLDAGHWYLTFSAEDDAPEPDEEDTVAGLLRLSEAELLEKTFGGDRGVAIPLAGNHGQRFDFSPVQRARMVKKEARARRWQRRMSRRPKGSKNREKAKRQAAAAKRYVRNVREDFAHQASHQLVADERYVLYVFEDLAIRNMTAAPKPKPDGKGGWLKNGARAKAGLNKAILASAWGRTAAFTQYKARRAGKLSLRVSPHHSSQECAQCGHIHPENRPDQPTFLCQRCGNTDHADHNAGQVIARRGVRRLLSGEYRPPQRKRCALRRRTEQELGPGRSEVTPGESIVSRVAGNGQTRGTRNQEAKAVRPETPATTAPAI